MGSARISKTLHSFLQEQKRNGESFEDVVLRLLAPIPVSNWKEEQVKSIHLENEVKDLIREYRLTDGESLNNILTRLFLWEK